MPANPERTAIRPRYRFGPFVLSPAHRRLLAGGREVALIPRYLDLLLLLVERRREAVSRQEILDRVWSDVVVSEGALNQAVRTLRRVLGDDPRSPRFLRTVSRHGYQFVYHGVIEEEDGELPAATGAPLAVAPEPKPWLGPRASAVLSAALGGAAAGVAAAVLFGAGVLAGGGGPVEILAVLALVGLAIGGVGAAGVGAGLVLAERWVGGKGGPAPWRAPRAVALVTGGALGGGLVGAVAHTLGQWSLATIFGRTLESTGAVGGGLEGVVLGAAAGLGYALGSRPAASRSSGSGPSGSGPDASLGARRLPAALAAGLCCGLAALLLTWTGRRLSGESLDFIGRAFAGSRVGLAPLAHLFGEAEPGLVTRTVLGAAEGLLFGIGLVLGLTRRGREA